MSGSLVNVMDAVTYRVEPITYGPQEVFAALEHMAAQGAVCLYESPRKAQCTLAADVLQHPKAFAAWWEECTSCTVSHAGAELRLEKAPFVQQATGRLLQDVAEQAKNSAAAGNMHTGVVRQSDYVLRRHKEIPCMGKLVYKEYFQPNSHGMLQCCHTRTAGLVRG